MGGGAFQKHKNDQGTGQVGNAEGWLLRNNNNIKTDRPKKKSDKTMEGGGCSRVGHCNRNDSTLITSHITHTHK